MLLDTSQSFDRVNYIKLLTLLLNKQASMSAGVQTTGNAIYSGQSASIKFSPQFPAYYRRYYSLNICIYNKLEGSMFRNFRLCIPLRVHGVSVRRLTWWMDICIRGLNPFYGEKHVFPEWHHNCVGSIILCGCDRCVEYKLGVITEYLVSLWCHIFIIIFRTVQTLSVNLI